MDSVCYAKVEQCFLQGHMADALDDTDLPQGEAEIDDVVVEEFELNLSKKKKKKKKKVEVSDISRCYLLAFLSSYIIGRGCRSFRSGDRKLSYPMGGQRS